ncbi:hypothetical protein [Sciscionella sediminilitoris]|uniref:hypothetical protein n=1 Tax=Sciscionella sediminilitoris TaxID=1445613 RepID=UPI0004DF76EA|nr:hypothetical protein [Sciscionella sp. SE31]
MDKVLIALISGGVTLLTSLATMLISNRRADRRLVRQLAHERDRDRDNHHHEGTLEREKYFLDKRWSFYGELLEAVNEYRRGYRKLVETVEQRTRTGGKLPDTAVLISRSEGVFIRVLPLQDTAAILGCTDIAGKVKAYADAVAVSTTRLIEFIESRSPEMDREWLFYIELEVNHSRANIIEAVRADIENLRASAR